MKTWILAIAFFTFKCTLFAQCPLSMENIYPFTLNNVQYEIVKENLNWISAAECAVLRGGKLAEINSQQEQDSLFHHVNLAGINVSNTIGWDGGGASYLWIGGNDLSSEGNWVWNGDNNESSVPFWIGTSSGSPVNGLYSNWGDEPDNWNNQDGLGFAITNWPLGLAGQWNDVFATDELYYVIEFSGNAEMKENDQEKLFSLFPNPATNEINVEISGSEAAVIQITDIMGHTLLTTKDQGKINISTLPAGVYQVSVSSNQKTSVQLFVIE